jgi:hypothetical protein
MVATPALYAATMRYQRQRNAGGHLTGNRRVTGAPHNGKITVEPPIIARKIPRRANMSL